MLTLRVMMVKVHSDEIIEYNHIKTESLDTALIQYD